MPTTEFQCPMCGHKITVQEDAIEAVIFDSGQWICPKCGMQTGSAIQELA